MAGSSAVVTPGGVRAGDPSTLHALCDRRGPAVLAYCERVCAPGEAVAAAADAFARFRAAVAGAERPAELDPEGLLFTETRHAAAARAPRARVGSGLARRLGARVSPAACALVPDLLVARAEHRLSDADEQRLERHLERCTSCHAAGRRFAAAQDAYSDPPQREVPAPAVAAIVAALAAAAPVVAEPGEVGAEVVEGAAAEGAPAVGEEAAAEGASAVGEGAPADEVPVNETPVGEAAAPADHVDAPAIVPPELDDVVVTDARAEEPHSFADEHPPAYAAEGPAEVAGADLVEFEAHRATGNGNGTESGDLAQPAYDEPPIVIHGHPGEPAYLPEMPAEIAPRPGHHPRPQRRETEHAHRHGPAWGLLLPAVVFAGALAAVLALAGVFSGGSHRSAVVTAPLRPAAAAPPAKVHRAARHRKAHSRAVAKRHVATRRPTTSTAAASAGPATPAPAASSPASPAPAVTHSAPAAQPAPSAPTTVQAVGSPSGAAPPSGGAPATGGTGYQPGG